MNRLQISSSEIGKTDRRVHELAEIMSLSPCDVSLLDITIRLPLDSLLLATSKELGLSSTDGQNSIM